jgi:hypothetical protein
MEVDLVRPAGGSPPDCSGSKVTVLPCSRWSQKLDRPHGDNKTENREGRSQGMRQGRVKGADDRAIKSMTVQVDLSHLTITSTLAGVHASAKKGLRSVGARVRCRFAVRPPDRSTKLGQLGGPRASITQEVAKVG